MICPDHCRSLGRVDHVPSSLENPYETGDLQLCRPVVLLCCREAAAQKRDQLYGALSRWLKVGVVECVFRVIHRRCSATSSLSKSPST